MQMRVHWGAGSTASRMGKGKGCRCRWRWDSQPPSPASWRLRGEAVRLREAVPVREEEGACEVVRLCVRVAVSDGDMVSRGRAAGRQGRARRGKGATGRPALTRRGAGVPDCDALWDAEGVRLGLWLDVTDWEGACDGLTVMEGDTLGSASLSWKACVTAMVSWLAMQWASQYDLAMDTWLADEELVCVCVIEGRRRRAW